MGKDISKISREYEAAHRKAVNAMARRVERLIRELTDSAAMAAEVAGITVTPDMPLEIDRYPALKARMDELARGYAEDLEAAIRKGAEREYRRSGEKNAEIAGDEMLEELYGRQGGWRKKNDRMLEAYSERWDKGVKLSDRVWNITEQTMQEMELAMDLGLGEGKSAAAVSRSVRQYLKEPNKLFRRVRNERGELRLSKAAKAYHPGRGVYRSSYKNALRLTITEGNIAYHTADHETWSQEAFVKGIRVCLSNNHTCNGVPFTDICDDLAGVYPKDFKFTGWHPMCRCYQIPVLKSREEMREDTRRILEGEHPLPPVQPEAPKAWHDWVRENADRIAVADDRGKLPYFLRDNRRYWEKGLTSNAPIRVFTMKGDSVYGRKLGRSRARQIHREMEDMAAIRLEGDMLANAKAAAKAVGAEYKPMTFNEADGKRPNMLRDDQNCQSCVVIHEARLRGINVSARIYKGNEAAKQLSLETNTAWYRAKDGKRTVPTLENVKGDSDADKIRNLKKVLETPGRYHIGVDYKDRKDGHIITVISTKNSQPILYDPQSGAYLSWDSFANIARMEYLRVDKLHLNIDVFKKIATKEGL